MNWKKLIVKDNVNLKETLKRMDEGAEKILFVVNKNNLIKGVITDGDIRRHFLHHGTLNANVSQIYNTKFMYAKNGYKKKDIKKLMLEKKIEVLPVIDNSGRIIDALSWADVFGSSSSFAGDSVSVPVVIMAGGRGERLAPFTKILPKALIPIGEKPIIEIIMDKFNSCGVKKFYVTINHKGEMVKVYFESTPKPYAIEYIKESDFLGTAGSLKLLPSKIEDTFIVSNCDIIVTADYRDLLEFHAKNKNLLTVVGSIQHYRIPYGILHFKKEGRIKNIQEKPEFDFTVNTGVYVLSKKAIDFIPKNKRFDMTDLIGKLIKNKKKVGVYPISEKSYMDTGQWEEYKKHMEGFII